MISLGGRHNVGLKNGETLEDTEKSGRKEVISCGGNGSIYSFSPGNIQWSSSPGT